MKLLKLLCIPAAVAAAALAAVPAYAHSATVTKLTSACNQASQVCVHVEATTTISPANATRAAVLTLLGHKTGDSNATHFVPVDGVATITIQLKPGSNTFDECFANVPTTGFDKFKVQISKQSADEDLALDTMTTDAIAICAAAQSPSPPSSPGPSASPVVQALAATGGFDYRFPLLGLPLLVGGLALLLVTVARGRRSQTK